MVQHFYLAGFEFIFEHLRVIFFFLGVVQSFLAFAFLMGCIKINAELRKHSLSQSIRCVLLNGSNQQMQSLPSCVVLQCLFIPLVTF